MQQSAELFEALDLNSDGRLERGELKKAALTLKWHWNESPLYALLDFLTVRTPLNREDFVSVIDRILQDPMGPYGEVLSCSPISQLETAIEDASSARLFIDLQHSFTDGVWMQSLGPDGREETAPIAEAFERCAQLLAGASQPGPTMFTRCPFPPDSYDWNPLVAELMDPHQPYFIKPGNSALWPSTNGYTAWLESCVVRRCPSLVIGGCTLNSCVRVTALETAAYLRGRLEVVVDLSLCGARAGNYRPSPEFGGTSSVAAAVKEMCSAGVRVVPRVVWSL